MPINKKESLIYTTLMCIFMVYFMSVYNLMFQVGAASPGIAKLAVLANLGRTCLQYVFSND